MEQTENQRLGVEVEQNHSVSCFPATFSPLKPLRRLPFFPKKSIPLYVWCSVYTALGGFIWGFDTGSIGPITVMPQFLSKFGHISPTVQGLIVSCILITASIASIFAGPISERISRTYTIAIGGVVNAIGWAIMCSADGLPQLFAGRLIAGVGEGLFIAMITVYACEIAPAAYRGRIATVVQLFNVVGIAVGFFVCYGTQRIQNDFSWRFPLGLQAVVATAIAIGTPFFPHSPRWLRAVGRTEEAKATWIRLGLSSLEAEKEDESIQRAGQNVVKLPWWKEAQLLWGKDVRYRTLLGCFLLGAQQASGIDGILYYAPVVFSQAGLSSTKSSFLASGVTGLLGVVSTIISQYYQDKWGRRPQAIIGGVLTGCIMTTIGIIYASGAGSQEAGRWAVVVLIYLFTITYMTLWGIILRTVCSEIQPMRTRAAATSVGQCANWVVNWIIAFSTPSFLARSISGPYFLFGGCCLFTTLVCFAFQPETKGVALEDLDNIFDRSPWKKAQSILKSKRERRRMTDDHEQIELGRVRHERQDMGMEAKGGNGEGIEQ